MKEIILILIRQYIFLGKLYAFRERKCAKIFLFAQYEQVVKKIVRVTYDLDHARWRESCSGFFLTKNTHINIISEIYCYVLPTFCCDKSLASSFVLF